MEQDKAKLNKKKDMSHVYATSKSRDELVKSIVIIAIFITKLKKNSHC